MTTRKLFFPEHPKGQYATDTGLLGEGASEVCVSFHAPKKNNPFQKLGSGTKKVRGLWECYMDWAQDDCRKQYVAEGR